MAQDVYNYRQKETLSRIVGDGMIARALKNIQGWENDVIFSSGVSNSGEADPLCYKREIDLLKFHLEELEEISTLVYFSTTSIFDSAKSGDPYIQHKLSVERLLRSSNKNYLILRLPNLVGKSSNPHTLTNYFSNCIREERPVSIKNNAIRHLIDVADLPVIMHDVKCRFGKKMITVNVETDRPLPAIAILIFLEKAIGKRAILQPLDKRRYESRDTEIFKTGLNHVMRTDHDYHINLLKKYYSNILHK